MITNATESGVPSASRPYDEEMVSMCKHPEVSAQMPCGCRMGWTLQTSAQVSGAARDAGSSSVGLRSAGVSWSRDRGDVTIGLVLVHAFLKVEPGTRMWVQVFHLGEKPRSRTGGQGRVYLGREDSKNILSTCGPLGVGASGT